MSEENEAKCMFMLLLNACSAIARDREKYKTFCDSFRGAADTGIYKRVMQKMQGDVYLSTQFCQGRSASLVIKTADIYAIVSATDGFSRADFCQFLKKHFKRAYGELKKRKGSFPPISFFEHWTKSISEVIEQVCVYTMLYTDYHGIEDVGDIEVDDETIGMCLGSLPLLAEPCFRERKYAGNISNNERALRNALLAGGGPVSTYLDESNDKMLSAVSMKFCYDDVMAYDFKAKDANALARCIERDYFANGELAELEDKGKNLDEIADPETLGDIRMDIKRAKLEARVDTINLNYARLMYAFGKIQSDDRAELFELFTSRAQEKKSEAPPDEALKRALEEKNNVIQEKQKQLNSMQMELDKIKNRFAEVKSKYIDAKHAAEDAQKLLEKIQSGKVHVTDIEKCANVSFPGNTLLFGGHPNWIRKFRLKYPKVKVYDADDMSFTAEVIRNADLILLNVSHMSHKQYGPVIRVVRQYHKRVEYIK